MIEADNGLVNALPVIDIITLAPLALEGGLSLTDGCRIIEIPLPVTC